ncbi:Sua5/YciO/YrdC/YwlC family protein [Candidatus Palibaumannia cicadellinicola]|uniref:Threonylcarbamoyl-AMP synthase n=1 Tax=Candidatus Palibaumannia cicadellinicola TaxID=186490 RepID=A0A088N218_9GAMM|nr:Sua5/YciO/YrdC/YwlC family protein [Candidatus Baumannia cicadellinicola]AIN47336.1 protein involved in synthesis of threonylcarbamoyladenosine-modified tRNA [Candidatus Baumannia cicadellinicola]
MLNITNIVALLRQQQVIAYPTEAIFGLGCDPDSEKAVHKLLVLKRRDWQKGLILVAATYAQLTNYIDDSSLNVNQRARIFALWPGPVTWVIPAHTTTPRWLTGKFSSLAVRVSAFEPVQKLCLAFGKPLVSTSANMSGDGESTARNISEVHKQFGATFPVMDGTVEGRRYPSEIRDALSGELIRQG